MKSVGVPFETTTSLPNHCGITFGTNLALLEAASFEHELLDDYGSTDLIFLRTSMMMIPAGGSIV